jgi:hypothetical protein
MRKWNVRDRSYGVVMTTENPFEPPLAGSELDHLVGAINRMRSTFRWKADGLDSDALAAKVGRSQLTLGGLLKHLALVEDDIHTSRLTGEPLGDLWDFSSWDSPEWQFTSAVRDTPEQLYALYDGAVERSRGRLAAVVERGGLDQLVAVSNDEGEHASLRRLMLDLLEEYGRHVGHADLLRESVDGRVGEDPPPDWRPVAGTPWLDL